jgi:hypothetical protein
MQRDLEALGRFAETIEVDLTDMPVGPKKELTLGAASADEIRLARDHLAWRGHIGVASTPRANIAIESSRRVAPPTTCLGQP